MADNFDVIVVGGGHAGCEAAAVAARMGARVALVSMRRDMIGAMSCNPAIGGLGKGHLVREVDAFDGLIARAADRAAIHYRMLNASKGTAVQGPRIQADRKLYKAAIHQLLAELPTLEIIEGSAERLIIGDVSRGTAGLILGDSRALEAKAVVLATGTFLNAKLHFGMDCRDGGRVGEAAAIGLAGQLRALDLPIARLKTGTPPRLDGRTIDWAPLDRQASDSEAWTFSAMSSGRAVPQLACAITRTNQATHDVIRAGLDRSPLFSGVIQGWGRATARRSRTRSTASATATAIRSSSSPRRAGRSSRLSQRRLDLAPRRCPACDAAHGEGARSSRDLSARLCGGI